MARHVLGITICTGGFRGGSCGAERSSFGRALARIVCFWLRLHTGNNAGNIYMEDGVLSEIPFMPSGGPLWIALYKDHTLLQYDGKANVIIAAQEKDHALATLHTGLDCRRTGRYWQVYYQNRKLDYAIKEDEAGVMHTQPVIITAQTKDEAIRTFLNRTELTETAAA